MATSRHSRRLLRRLLSESRRYRPRLVAMFFLGLLAVPLVLLAPLPLKIAIDSGLGGQPLPAPLRSLPGLFTRSFTAVLLLAAVMQILVVIVLQIQSIAYTLVSTHTGEKLTLAIRSALFHHMQRLSLAYHDEQGTADAIYRVQYDAPAIKDILIDGTIPLASAALAVVGMVVVTFRIDPSLAIIAMAVIPFLLLSARTYRSRTRRHYKQAKSLESAALGVVQEVFTSLRVVKAFGSEDREEERFRGRATAGLLARIRLTLFESVFSLVVNLITAIGTAAVLIVGIGHVRSQTLTLGELLIVIAYLSQLYSPLKTISKKAADLQTSFAGAERVFEVFDLLPDVEEPAVPKRPDPAIRGRIEFKDVQFSYGAGEPVLDGVDFVIEPGTRVALVGRTGAGKTTLVNLLARFYDPRRGRILLDGVDLRDYELGDLRSQFALVLQDPVLFSTSIAENIAYAKPGASREEIVAAAHAAGADAFIRGLAGGYDSLVGERGMRLSGGERQRIALARAFLKDAPVLILDEPTSSIDVRTERDIMRVADRLMQGRTTIVVTHRASTARRCEARIELGGGRIVSSSGVLAPGGVPRSRNPRSSSAVRRRKRSGRDTALHPAAAAWQSTSPCARVPSSVDEMLTPHGRRPWKSSVYLLREAMSPGTNVIAKRTSAACGALERRVYDDVLTALPLETPRLLDSIEDGEHVWLFIEEVTGDRYSETARNHRRAAAAWLARLHVETSAMTNLADLPDRGPDQYLGELRSAKASIRVHLSHRTFGPEGNAALADMLDHLDRIEARWEFTRDACVQAPRCLVHGDFTSKNVLVGKKASALHVVDWGSSGWGPPAADLPAVGIRSYGSAIRERWPDVDRSMLQRLEITGRIFRTVEWAESEVAPAGGPASDRAMRRIADCERHLRHLAHVVEAA